MPDGSVFAFTTNPPCVPVSSTKSPAIPRNLAHILSGWVHGSTGHWSPACLKSHPLLGSISHWLPQLSVQSLNLIMSPSLHKFSLIPPYFKGKPHPYKDTQGPLERANLCPSNTFFARPSGPPPCSTHPHCPLFLKPTCTPCPAPTPQSSIWHTPLFSLCSQIIQ